MLRLSVSTKVNFALSCGLGILLLLGVFGFYSIGEFFKSSADARRLSQVMRDLDLVRRSIERAEAAQLRFRLTGAAAERAEFKQMRASALAKLDELGGMLPDQEQKHRLSALVREARAHLAGLANAMQASKSGFDFAAATAAAPLSRNADAVRDILDAIGDQERRKARENDEWLEDLIGRFVTLAVWSGSIAVTLLLWTITVVVRYERNNSRAQAELARARERLASALEGSKSAVWDWDVGRNEIFLSAGWPQMLGTGTGESTVRPADLLDLVHPEDVARVQAAIKSAMSESTEDYREEHRVRHASGDWIWILSHGQVVRRDARGMALRITGINQDVTERKRIELELKEHDLQLQLALVTAGMVRWNWEVAANDFVWPEDPWRLVGAAPLEGYARLDDMVLPQDLVGFLQKLDQAAMSGEPYKDDYRITRTDGTIVWVSARGYSVRGADGKIERIVGVAQDVSEIKQAEEALRASERELRLITDSIPAFITYVDAEETVRFCNNALAHFVGAPPADIIGRSVRQLYGDAVYQVIQPYVRRALAGERVQFQRAQAKRDGGMIDLDATYVPRRGVRGEVEGYYALLTDITELKRLDRMKSEFVSTVSHELRTPLTSIRGSLGILAGGVAGPLSDKVRGFIDIAKDSCERLIRLINDILDMEKIESGRMTFQLQMVELAELVEQAVAANEGYAHQHGVRLRVEAHVPGARVHVDRDRLAQVLTNLISNACKFSPKNSSVDIGVSADGVRARVSVVDHGPGISDEFRKRIFQKFSQEDSSDMRQKGGTGLGLSISKAIVAGLGGEIGFDSEPGKGSTFFFYLPLWREPVAAHADNAGAEAA